MNACWVRYCIKEATEDFWISIDLKPGNGGDVRVSLCRRHADEVRGGVTGTASLLPNANGVERSPSRRQGMTTHDW